MIIRLMVVDPNPDPKRTSDVLVYQVPENSREYHLLVHLFTQAGLDYTQLETPQRKEIKI